MLLAARDLEVTYERSVKALRGVTIEVPEGGVVAVLGSNGAGKSTLLRAISNTLRLRDGRIDAGTVELDGRSLRGRAPADIVAAGVVQVPEGRHVFERLTVEENLRVGAFNRKARAGRAAAERRVFELFSVLADRRAQRAGLLSGGEQQMLVMGRALMAEPRLLLLDEPSLGLAPLIVGQVGRIIGDINAQGVSVLLIEQNASMALSVATSAYVLEVGRVSLSGSAEDLSNSDEVRNLYLGRGAEAVAASADRATHPVLDKWTTG